MLYFWLKLLHIFFIISWFAGLFYLPRIYVNLAILTPNSREYALLLGMSNRLFKFMTPIGILALLFGIAIVWHLDWWRVGGWIHIKIFIGLLLAGYHFWCYRILLSFRQGSNQKSHQWFRIFNEVPVFLMFAALFFVIFKPFS